MNDIFTVTVQKLDRGEALRYLAAGGYKPDERVSALMDECESALLEKIRGKFCYRVFDIDRIENGEVTLKNCSLVLRGKDIRAHLEGCEKAALLCATIGSDADKLIRRTQIEDMAKAVITDAMASCAAEQVCDKAEKAIGEAYPGMFMTWRFSAGYGDLPIETQKLFLEVTNAGRAIGLFCSESHILSPKKSVTAVIGLSDSPVEKKRRGCATCNLKGNCAFREKGEKCF